MPDPSKLNDMLAEMRSKGKLPALDANVATICSLTSAPEVATAELTSVILRDPALTADILSTANSALYLREEPIRTISAAVLILGTECVRSLALGLGILKQFGRSAGDRNLHRLFACSYFSGMFAMALGKRTACQKAEELFVAGLLSQLPRLLLAHAFPERYAAMERRVAVEKLPLERVCEETFGVGYSGLAGAIARYWNLPAGVAAHLQGKTGSDIGTRVLGRAAHVADLMFGNEPGGAEALASAAHDIQGLLNDAKFEIGPFVAASCAADPNVQRFFGLAPKDVEMMVRIAEWGRANPAEVASGLTFGAQDPSAAAAAAPDPAVLIGHYLTELTIASRRGTDINRVLLTGLEAIYRCVKPDGALLSFLDPSKQRIVGRFFLGSASQVRITDYVVELRDRNSPAAESMRTRLVAQTSVRRAMPHPFLIDLNLDAVFLVPIVARGDSIGLCVVGREAAVPFTEQERMWMEAVVGMVASAFERTRPGGT
jgi:HD-like signal output (HDOD) protein